MEHSCNTPKTGLRRHAAADLRKTTWLLTKAHKSAPGLIYHPEHHPCTHSKYREVDGTMYRVYQATYIVTQDCQLDVTTQEWGRTGHVHVHLREIE